MAKLTVNGSKEYARMLSKLSSAVTAEEITQKAIYKGAGIVADEIADAIAVLPEERHRRLRNGEMFTGVSASQKADLLNGLGISPMKQNDKGDYDAKIGFDGYGSFPTKRFPKGVPNVYLARTVESGSSIRVKHRFVFRAVQQSRNKAKKAMGEVIDSEIAKIMK